MNAPRTVLAVIGWLMLVSVLAVAAQVPTESVAPMDEIENLSEDRIMGLGIQVDFPWGGLISVRSWLSSTCGAEGIFFVWGDAHGLEGSATVRGLYRVADAPAVDFYLAGGATLPFSPARVETLLISMAGGIEFGFRFAQNLAWNIEFGISASLIGEVMMVFGTGVHFYF